MADRIGTVILARALSVESGGTIVRSAACNTTGAGASEARPAGTLTGAAQASTFPVRAGIVAECEVEVWPCRICEVSADIGGADSTAELVA